MHCKICDATLAEIHYNSDLQDYEPCGTCLAVIEDTLAGFTDKPSASEDELGAESFASLVGLSTEHLVDYE